VLGVSGWPKADSCIHRLECLTPSSEVELALAGGCGRVCFGFLDTLMHAPRDD
jgi:hypothetical protein